ncbi:MAG: enoyl-CoA hydratase/isomerase family protein [Syntrophaceae bacterium]|nr:enoyl-CoA hydratase/isomerase family protein [Syntrophaceae bacterium]
MEYEKILFEKQGRLAFITLNEANRMNPIGIRMQREIVQAIEEINNDDEIRVSIIRGKGKHFSVGYALTDIDPASTVAWQLIEDRKGNMLEDRNRLYTISKRWMNIWESPKSFICQVQGNCLAGANDIALVCDMVIAAEDSRFGHPGVRGIGTPISAPWTYLLGSMRAKRLLLTGDTISGKEAAEWGLITMAVPRDKLEAEVLRMAKRMAAIPNDMRAINKYASNKVIEMMGFRESIISYCELNAIGHFMPTVKEFWARVGKDGLREALKWRDRDFEEIEEFSSYQNKSE